MPCHTIAPRVASVCLFVCCLFVYLINGDFPNNPDSLPNAYLSLSILREGDLTFTPEEIPELFEWELVEGDEHVRIPIEAMDDHLRSMIASGNLRATDAGYFALPVGDGRYVNTFGPGVGVACVPFFAVGQWLGIDYSDQPGLVWRESKVAAATYTAGSVAFVYMTLIRMTSIWPAILLALAYALGTPEWSSSSQSLWQHAPTDFFLALGVWLFLWPNASRAASLGSGLALAASVCCRPTIAFVVIWLAAYRILFERNRVIAFMLGAAPLAVALAIYNHTFLGSPIKFGQSTYLGKTVEATGREGIWSTPVVEGLWAHLVCPSRGLVEFCPFLIPAFAGILVAWVKPAHKPLRPLSVGLACLFVVQAKYYDWWGGFSYGPRHLVDAMPILILFLVPVLGLLARPIVAVPFGLALAWSIFVQGVGVTLYDVISWNGRPGLTRTVAPEQFEYTTDLGRYLEWVESGIAPVTVERLTIDDPRFRQRLWSWSDQQIAYYLTHAGMSRWQRAKDFERNSRSRAERLNEAHMLIGHCYSARDNEPLADAQYELAMTLDKQFRILYEVKRDSKQNRLMTPRDAKVSYRIASLSDDTDWSIDCLVNAMVDAPVYSVLDIRESHAICPIIEFSLPTERHKLQRRLERRLRTMQSIRLAWLAWLNGDRLKADSYLQDLEKGGMGQPWPLILKCTMSFGQKHLTEGRRIIAAMEQEEGASRVDPSIIAGIKNVFEGYGEDSFSALALQILYEAAKTRRPNANERAWWLDP